MAEYLDVVDDSDNVVGRALKDEVYNKRLPHRIVHIIIFDKKGRMLLQLRANSVNYCPGHWCSAVAGHVQSGESYEEAAIREFEEELGFKADFKLFGKVEYISELGIKKFITIFRIDDFEGLLQVNPEEVESAEYRSMEEIKRMREQGEKIHPELLFFLERYFK